MHALVGNGSPTTNQSESVTLKAKLSFYRNGVQTTVSVSLGSPSVAAEIPWQSP